jgi:glycosyltransferase involved in cell wall biosynthesis
MDEKTNKKVLFLSNDCGYFISHRLPVAIACREAGYEVHVAGPLSASIDQITAHGFSYHEIEMCGRISNLFKELATLAAIIKLYRSVRPDLVHLVAIKSVLFGSIAAHFAKVPALVNAVTGLGFLFISESFKVKILRFLVMRGFRFGFRHANCRILFQNRDDSDLFVNSNVAYPDKITIIRGSGVDVNQFFPREGDEGTPVVVLPTRMLWDKGVAEFVEAARILKTEGVQARFVLVGDTYEANPATISKSKLAGWDSSGVVEWWGQRNDMHEVFRQAHIVCLPSYREGLPKVLIEAAACGRPIVTTDVPGCREVVIDGKNGYLVPVKNSGALAAKLKILINNPVLRKQMGIKGREFAIKEFAIDKIVCETLNCYKELLKCQPY